MNVYDMLLDANIGAYIDEVEYNAKGSLVEELDRQNLAIRFRSIVEESVKIMVCEHAGIARDVDEEALRYIGDFNTVDVITQLGTPVDREPISATKKQAGVLLPPVMNLVYVQVPPLFKPFYV